MLLLLCAFLFIQAKATHYAGGEITVNHITGNTYQVTLKIYRDCSGINLGSTQQVQITPTNSGSVISLARVSITDITPICGASTSICSGGTIPGIEEHVYRGNITLNALPAGQVYTFVHQSCCRTFAITTLQQPGNTGSYFSSILSPNESPRNSSPQFLNAPVVYLCANQSSSFSPGAVDPDGDVLQFSLTSPRGQNGVPVTYMAGYSPTSPLTTAGGVSIDANTGQITFTPTAVEFGVMAIRCEEFRNGVKIGEVVRDINIIVQSCNNGLPTATGINGTNNFSTGVCPGETISFNINSSDLDGDPTTLTWNNAIPGATFTTNGATNETGTFTWTPGATQTGTFNFTATVTDVACPVNGSNTYTYTINVGNPNATLTVNDAVCGNNGSATIVTDTSASTVTWSTGATGPTVSGLAPGNYSVIVAQGTCADTTAFTVQSIGGTVSLSDSIYEGPCVDSCGRSITLTASSGPGATFTAQWSDGGSGLSRTGLCPGTYDVTVTDNNGCSATGSYTIGAYSPVTVSASSTDHDCGQSSYNGSASLSISGGIGAYNVQWSNGANISNLSGLAPGTYSYTVTSGPGCSASGSVTVGTSGSLNGSATSVSTTCGDCNGTAAVNLTSGVAPISYLWTNGNNSANIRSLCAGSYSVAVSDAAGCSGSFSTQVGSSDPLSMSGSSTATTCGDCNGTASVSINTGVAPVSVVWSNGATGATISGLCAGTYTAIGTDAFGCTDTVTVQVAGSFTPTIATTVTPTSCNVCNGGISVRLTNATPAVSYLWSNGATSGSLSGLCPGTYSVTVTDGNGCVLIDTATVDPSVAPIASTLATPTSCGLCNGAVDLSVSSGTPPFTYGWTGGASSEDISDLCSGSYSVSVIDANGCTASSTASVGASTGIKVMGDATDVSCYGSCDGSAWVSFPRTKAGNYSISWDNGGSTDTITGLCKGEYTAIVTDPEGCSDTIVLMVDAPEPLTLGYLATPSVCGASCSGSVDLIVRGGTPPYSFAWSDGSTTEDLSGVCGGTYEVTVTDGNGCSMTTCVTVPNGELEIDLTVEDPTCAGKCNGSIRVDFPPTSSPPFTINWSNGRSGRVNGGLCGGTYTVTVSDGSGCTKIDTITLNTPAPLSLSFAVNPPSSRNACDGDIDLTVSGGTPAFSYHWNHNILTEDLSNVCDGVYNVQVTDANGCKEHGQVKIKKGSYTTQSRYAEDLEVVLFPNPTEDRVNLNFNFTGESQMGSTTVADLTGRSIIVEGQEIQNGDNSIQIELGELPSGTYLISLELDLDGTRVVETVIKK